MTQIADILRMADEAQQQKIDAVLATVVRTEGSAYRRAGAMMLILEDGRSVGMISGGCLEPHIIKRAFWLTRGGANVQSYQTGDDIGYTDDGKTKPAFADDARLDSEIASNEVNEDWGNDLRYAADELNFGLGCNGRVHVLFERLKTAMPVLNLIRQVRKTQKPATIATLIRTGIAPKSYLKNCDYLPIGTRLDLDAYNYKGQIAILETDKDRKKALPKDSESKLANSAQTLLQHYLDHNLSNNNTEYVFIENDAGAESTEWLIQRVEPQIRLLICGAGDDVLPLVTMAKLQDWHVTVIDSRPRYATCLRFPQADVVMHLPLEATEKLLELSNNAAVALMSHSLSQDRSRLATLLEHAEHYKYIGQLGPRYRTERLINEISATKADPSILNAGISKLHYPIGYKLGGDGPEALALGIMAQINAVMHDKVLPAAFLPTETTHCHMLMSQA
ncbi:XdhC family protein [Psychrobacter jeotgali]|uniref:XdhC family protein n=1 Tax=Psychrobacter jeotgali TaxID=179010 RepID=UPI00191AB16A|nr:XdhC/CoxI family protein [Psychrobacter jeotgali]